MDSARASRFFTCCIQSARLSGESNPQHKETLVIRLRTRSAHYVCRFVLMDSSERNLLPPHQHCNHDFGQCNRKVTRSLSPTPSQSASTKQNVLSYLCDSVGVSYGNPTTNEWVFKWWQTFNRLPGLFSPGPGFRSSRCSLSTAQERTYPQIQTPSWEPAWA
jgi:hypothetical protein